MKIYGIAKQQHQVYGHGDSGTEYVIAQCGAYGQDGFPPFFQSRQEAEEHITTMFLSHHYSVIELELRP